MMTNIKKSFVKIKNIDTAYIKRQGGEKVALVLHGWGANIESVMPIINSIPPSYTVYAYDGPGFGDSDNPDYVYGTYDYYEFLKEFCRQFDIKKASFIGHSFGGKTLTILGSRDKDLVEKLILIDASGIIPKRKLSYYVKVYTFKTLKKLYLLTHKNDKNALEKFYKNHGSDDYQNSQGIMRKVFVKVVNESTLKELSAIKAQTLLLWGDKDDATPLYMGKIFEKEIENSGLVVLNGGHFSYIDDFGTFRAVINSFLGE